MLKIKSTTLSLIIALLASTIFASIQVTPAYAAVINVSGNITTNTTWTTGNIYVVQGHVTVNSGVTLIVQQGVIIKFAANKLLGVNGVLKVQGTNTNPVIITSIKDDTAGGDVTG